MRKLISFIATLAIVSILFGRVGMASGASPLVVSNATVKVAPEILADMATLNAGEMVTVIVTLVDQQDVRTIPVSGGLTRQTAVINSLRAQADASQRGVAAVLKVRHGQGAVSKFEPFWIFNGFSVTATANVINELAARSDVLSITSDDIQIVPVSDPAYNTAEANLAVINAPALLSLGFAGQGVVIASMDTGVDVTHPDLASSWRGGSNSWFDPYNQHPSTPTDVNGHGTQTMGVMVGGDNGGTLIGAAPQAQWIAVKIFNDAGASSATAIHQGYQWLLDPDGNPNTADAPQVVNNSWAYGTPGCNLEFQADLQALLAVGILPVVSAGNYGPNGSTSVSPANYPEAFAVGATSNSDRLYAYSSRGPSACGEASTVYPELTAPGVAINTTDRYGLYYQATGTSLAAPHVSGALALLLSAFPGLTAEQQRAALLNSAVDLGVAGPDNLYGYGRLNVLAAYQLLAAGGVPTPTAVPPTGTPTATPIPPTATATITTEPPTATATTTTPLPTGTPTATSVPPTATTPPTATAVSTNSIFSDGFESGNLLAWTGVVDPENKLSVTAGAAMVGSKGLAALINTRTSMYLRSDSPISESGIRVKFYFDPNSVSLNNNTGHRIFAALDNSAAEVVRLDFRYVSGVYQLQASLRSDTGSYSTSSWLTISDAPHAIAFDWQAASGAGINNGYLTVWIDDLFQETIGAIDNDTLRIEEVRLGPLSGIARSTSGTEFFDEFALQRVGGTLTTPTPTPTATAVPPTATPLPPTATSTVTATSLPLTATATAVSPTATPMPPTATATVTIAPPTATAVSNDLIFSDGFESGDFSAWTAVIDQENDLAVAPGAAMVGNNGLAALIDNRTSMYLRDDSPQSEARYRVRFYFDPNSISMGSSRSHRILAARNNSAEVIRLDFRFNSGNYQVQGSVRTDSGSYVTTSWYTISDAPHAIEFDWQAASANGTNNGYFSLWIDTILQETKSGIDNDTLRIEEVQLGPLSGLDSVTLGTELFDDFVSKRTNPIGP